MDRRKELKARYKQMKPDMGLFVIRSKVNDKCYIEAATDIKSRVNSTKFKLNYGNHPNRELQKEWQEHGEASFSIAVLEKLEYDKDETKTDYSEELALLKMIWEEKLLQKGIKLYR
jgi:hypothetical protein